MCGENKASELEGKAELCFGHTAASTLPRCDPLLLTPTCHSPAVACALPGSLEQELSPSWLTLPQLQEEQHQEDL